jgi:putative colanic acid biosynthesis UDP-glucose lipid carrier transferase
MTAKAGRYSKYIRPVQIFIDIVIINIFVVIFMQDTMSNIGFHSLLTFFWLIFAYYGGYYEIYRFTKGFQVFTKILKQFLFIGLISFAYIGFKYKYVSTNELFSFLTNSVTVIALIKFSVYYLLRKYRLLYGGNFRSVIILGNGKSVNDLAKFFVENIDYGYDLKKIFDLKGNKKIEISEAKDYILKNKIDEIYGTIDSLRQREIDDLINFADNNLKTIKLIPDSDSVFYRNLALDYYGYLPIISLRKIPLDIEVNKRFKRFFDVIFSILMFTTIFFWFFPIIALLIKIESKGPVFFKQIRNGLNNKEFKCYKFRSMFLNSEANIKQVERNDPRITRIGKLLRKTSLDELPQFINVLKGEMSVVGPRPHMVKETERFAENINKFMVRHLIKPGITGLAQVSGYRGEVETENDIKGRVKYDIFYIENWSFSLDVKIIFLTVFNIFKGEKKAY